ncbi:MAG: extensin family protein [Proteobacteria bacterium]|nr:extensin family protein [Pseudomonadota bacterium]
MKAGARFFLGCGFAALLALAGCGRSMMWQGERAAWRGEAEAQCMQSGSVKLTSGVVRISPIEGPGVCGMDIPLKVAALGDETTASGYADTPPRPPSGISRADMPDWSSTTSRAAPARANYLPPPSNEQMRWMQGPPPANAPQSIAPPMNTQPVNAPQVSAPQTYQPAYNAPRNYEPQSRAPTGGGPMSIYAPGVNAPEPDDIPDDAELPDGEPMRQQPAYNAPPARNQASYTPPPLGPSRGSRFDNPIRTGAIAPATLTPAATLSCPIVSALDRWVSGGVQPAALHWFGSPVVEIKQISAYSCRGMVGARTSHISEHAFGNALDIAGFVLADGRKISVQHGWRGTPEEQGFLHDVQLFACDTFNTVLAPGYNAAHYNHIHVDLMRRASGRKPCRPNAIPGEVVAAKARAVYAARRGGKDYTGSIGKSDKDKLKDIIDAVPGADGLFDDNDGDVTGSIGGTEQVAIPMNDDDPEEVAKSGKKPRGWPIVLKSRPVATTSRNPADF